MTPELGRSIPFRPSHGPPAGHSFVGWGAARAEGKGERSAAVGGPSLPLSPLVGRDDQVDELIDLLAGNWFVTLTGAPGVGKSRLALEISRRLETEDRAAAVVVNVASLTHARQVGPTVARAVAAMEVAHSSRPSGGGEERSLVVLDDCDRVLEACADVAQVLLGQGMRILATAREPLRAEGETTWRVPPLSVPGPGQDGLPEVFTEWEAVQLFCVRAASVDRGFIPTPESAPAIAAICRRLQGVALAIDLAARSVTAFSPADIVAHLDDDALAVLGSAVRTTHPRHRSVRASVAWSYDSLPVAEQVLLARLAVFGGCFTNEAARRVGGFGEETAGAEVSQTLLALVDKSLLEVERLAGATCYRLLQTVRWFAAEKLVAAGEQDELAARHARWCAFLVESAGDPRQGLGWLERLEPYHDDIHQALEWALAGGAVDVADVMADADSRLCPAEGRQQEARERLARVVASGMTAPSVSRARVLGRVGVLAAMAGELETAVTHLERSAAVADDAGDAGEAARARATLGLLALTRGGPTAVVALQTAAAYARNAGDPVVLVDALVRLAWAHHLLGEPAAADTEFAESLELARSSGAMAALCHALVGLGMSRVVLGRHVEAEAALHEGLEMARALREQCPAGMAMAALGESARLRGDLTAAESWFSQAGELGRSLDLPYVAALGLLGLGRLALDDGDANRAGPRLEEALLLARRCSVALVVRCLIGLAELALDAARARSLIGEALAMAQGASDRAGEALAFEWLARLSARQGDYRRMAARNRHALLLRGRIGDPAAIATSLEALAMLAAARGDAVAAARMLGAAETLRERHGLVRPRPRQDEYTATVQSVRQALSEGSFEIEWDRGAGLSTGEAVSYALADRGPRQPRSTTGWDALTGAERTVAGLVAQGLTNLQIAHELGIAATTVKAHLRRIYSKLGIGNRGALAAEVHRRSSN